MFHIRTDDDHMELQHAHYTSAGAQVHSTDILFLFHDLLQAVIRSTCCMTHHVLSTTHPTVTSNTIPRDLPHTHKFQSQPGGLSRYSDSLRVGRSGDRISVEARFSTPVESGSGVHPASCTMRTTALLPSGTLTTHPHLASRLKKENRYTSIPPLCRHGRLYSAFYLQLYRFFFLKGAISLCITKYTLY